jgi:HlyD family secretion protein
MQSPIIDGRRLPSAKLLGIAAAILFGGVGAYTVWRSNSTAQTAQPAANVAPQMQTVTALGYLEPQGRVINLSAPSSSGGTSRVEKLLVKQGDAVKAGQVIAVLDSYDRLRVAVQAAEQQVKVAESDLAVVKAGAKRGEVNAQQSEIARLEAQRQGDFQAQVATVDRLRAELQNAQTES